MAGPENEMKLSFFSLPINVLSCKFRWISLSQQKNTILTSYYTHSYVTQKRLSQRRLVLISVWFLCTTWLDHWMWPMNHIFSSNLFPFTLHLVKISQRVWRHKIQTSSRHHVYICRYLSTYVDMYLYPRSLAGVMIYPWGPKSCANVLPTTRGGYRLYPLVGTSGLHWPASLKIFPHRTRSRAHIRSYWAGI